MSMAPNSLIISKPVSPDCFVFNLNDTQYLHFSAQGKFGKEAIGGKGGPISRCILNMFLNIKLIYDDIMSMKSLNSLYNPEYIVFKTSTIYDVLRQP